MGGWVPGHTWHAWEAPLGCGAAGLACLRLGRRSLLMLSHHMTLLRLLTLPLLASHPPAGGGPPGPGGYPNAGTPAFADTPGTVNPGGYGAAAYAPSPASYAPSPAGYAPSPAGYGPAGTPAVAGTPGMYAPAGTPGMYAPAGTPGVYGAADMPAPTPGGGQYGGAAAAGSGQDYSHWVDVEVKLPGGDHAVVRSVEGGAATVTVGQEAGEGRYAYPPDAPSRSVPCSDMQLVLADRKESIRIVRGEREREGLALKHLAVLHAPHMRGF